MEEHLDLKKPLLPPKLPQWWRAIPSLVLIVMISNIDGLILNDFIEFRYAHYYQINSTSTQNSRDICLNNSRTTASPSQPDVSTTITPHPISTTESWNDIVQASTARLNVYTSLAATVPTIFTSIILGANCDRIGRRPLLILPFVGKILRYVILTAVVYFDLANIWIILSVMLDGVFGTVALGILASFAYATDCTGVKNRTTAIIITDVAMGCSRFLPLVTFGIYLQQPRYVQSMMITLGLSIAGFLFCLFFQPESNPDVQHLNIFQQLKRVNLISTKRIIHVYFRQRDGYKRRTLLLLVVIHLSIITMICGFLAIYYLFLYGAPFCMDSWGVSLNSVVQAVAIILMTIPFTLSVAKHSDHLILPITGCAAYIAQLILFGLATKTWILYLAVCIGALFNVLIPIIRSRITKLVEPNEYAIVFILASVFESGGYYAISALANEIYSRSITFMPGLVFFVFGLVGFLGIVVMM